MKKMWILILMLGICLLGCGQADAPESVPQQTEQPPTETEQHPTETEAPTQEPTETVPPDPVRMLLESMTPEEKVGQLFLARCPESGAEEDIAQLHLGGMILFRSDFEGHTPEGAARKIRGLQDAAQIPLLIAVDEEGGTVCRVSSLPEYRAERFPSPRDLYAAGGLDYVLALESEKAELLSSLGINVNMAPVVDISQNAGAFMYKRSLGESPEVTGQFAIGAIDRMGFFGVGAVLKHFPGYGNNADTHVGIAQDSRSLEALEGFDLVPYRMAIQGGAQAILVSHTIVEAFDGENPATLSSLVHDYLRNDMGFAGVIVTDDLAMGAITEQYGAGEAAVLAVQAGNDLLCSSEYQVQYDAVLEAVRDGRISEEQLNTSAERILRWKESLGLIGIDLL